jgi:MYXO-CTERM domain-containing protein
VVVHDAQERSTLSSVADRGPAAYARAVPRDGGGAWLQYWLWYPRQDQDRGVVRTGRHEGDWEMVQFRVDARGRPREAVYAQHSGAERCPWSTVERRDGRPVLYAANGSHASYLRAGTRDRMWPDPNDEADGRGRVVQPSVVRVSADSPAWMRRRGRWGGARARWWIPGEQDSPRGPAFQPQGRWSDPEGWADSARSCRAGCDHVGECDGAETALGAGGAAALVGAGLLTWRRRRRSKTP